MARNSFFAEKRAQNNNPNFFNFMPIQEIQKNVKRIIRDVKYDNIVDTDYNYFANRAIIDACVSEAKLQATAAAVTVHALNYYINEVLNNNIVPDKSVVLYEEKYTACNEQLKQYARAQVWTQVYQMFVAIRDFGAPPISIKQIQNMQFNVNDL